MGSVSATQLHSNTQQTQHSNLQPPNEIEGLLGPPSPTPTNCLLVKNMFNPKEMNPTENWDFDIMKDVKGEVSKTGTVLHIFVDKNSQGFVYIKMATLESAIHTFN